MAVSPKMPAYSAVAEPDLAFHAERSSDRHAHPLVGLVNYGPYSRSLKLSVLDPIRIAVIAPKGMLRSAEGLVGELEKKYSPKERKQYLVDFLGFSRIFGIRAILAQNSARIEMPASMDEDLRKSSQTTPSTCRTSHASIVGSGDPSSRV